MVVFSQIPFLGSPKVNMEPEMRTNTITCAELVDAVQKGNGTARSDSAALVEDVFQIITDALVKGESVRLSGFGAFEPREKAARMGRNPRTKQEVPIPPRKVVVFKASPVIRDKVTEALAKK